MATSQKFLPHFHIPLQSGSNNVLTLMKRRYNSELFAQKVTKIKQAIPNVFIGVDVIVGFPGESEENFTESYNILKDLKPSFLHVFPYSERPNTPAVNYKGKVNPKVISKRSAALHFLSDELHRDFFQNNLGREEEVLFELARKGGLMYGFTKNYVKVEYPFQKELVGAIARVKLVDMAESGNFTIKLL